MNIYEKLQTMRVKLQNMNVKKTGENKFAGYKYYELGDILPPINLLMLEHKVAAVVTFGNEHAVLELVNSEKPEERICFSSPMAGATLKGAHDIQNLGAVETYQRRYLYMTAFEVVENDFFDATQGKDTQQEKPKPKQNKKPALSQEISNSLNEALTDYSLLTGQTTKQILSDIQTAIGKSIKAIDDNDGRKILDLLKTWTNQQFKDLGA